MQKVEFISSDRGRQRWLSLGLVGILGLGLVLVYWPLLSWLGRQSFARAQLHTGGVLVLMALGISMRDALRRGPMAPSINNEGLAYLALGFALTWFAGRLPVLALPLMLISLCLALAALLAFAFGPQGVRRFAPAFAGLFVFGLLAGLFPTLDWPLRRIAATWSAALLARLGAPVQLLLHQGRPPELLIAVPGQVFHVATECNGFGLLTSSLLVTAVLAARYRMGRLRMVILGLLAPLVAMSFNVLRITAIALAAPRLPSLPYPVLHEVIGLVFYTAGLAVLWQIARAWERPEPGSPVPARGTIRDGASPDDGFTLLYDGACPFCRREVGWLKRHGGTESMLCKDISNHDFNPSTYGLTREDVEARLHAVRADGTVVCGMEAVREAYRRTGHGWLMAPTGWPVLRPVFDALYRVFARNRIRWGRWLDRRGE